VQQEDAVQQRVAGAERAGDSPQAVRLHPQGGECVGQCHALGQADVVQQRVAGGERASDRPHRALCMQTRRLPNPKPVPAQLVSRARRGARRARRGRRG